MYPSSRHTPCSFPKAISSQESNKSSADRGDILDDPQLLLYELVYGLGTLCMILTGVCSSGVVTKITRRASSVLHNKLYGKVWAWALGAGRGCGPNPDLARFDF